MSHPIPTHDYSEDTDDREPDIDDVDDDVEGVADRIMDAVMHPAFNGWRPTARGILW